MYCWCGTTQAHGISTQAILQPMWLTLIEDRTRVMPRRKSGFHKPEVIFYARLKFDLMFTLSHTFATGHNL